MQQIAMDQVAIFGERVADKERACGLERTGTIGPLFRFRPQLLPSLTLSVGRKAPFFARLLASYTTVH